MDFQNLDAMNLRLRIMESVCHRNSRKSCLILSAVQMTNGQPEFREPVLEWQSAEIL